MELVLKANEEKIVYEKNLIVGNFCLLKNKQTHIIDTNEELKYHNHYTNGFTVKILIINSKVKKTFSSMNGTGFIYENRTEVRDDLFGFLGSIKEVEEGYFAAPVHSVEGKVFDNIELAKKYLYDAEFNRVKEATFKALARKEFSFTLNYILNPDGKKEVGYITELCLSLYGSYYEHNKDIATQYAKQYLEANIIGIDRREQLLVA